MTDDPTHRAQLVDQLELREERALSRLALLGDDHVDDGPDLGDLAPADDAPARGVDLAVNVGVHAGVRAPVARRLALGPVADAADVAGAEALFVGQRARIVSGRRQGMSRPEPAHAPRTACSCAWR